MKGFLNAHYKRKIESLPQNLQPAIYQPRSSQFANHKSARGLTQSQIANSKSARRLAILVDRRNWAYHEKALEKAQYIGDEWQTEIFFLEDNPKIDPAKFDLLYNFNHTPSKYDELFHGRLIKGLYSHYYLGSFTPWRYIYRMVKHASVLVVANRKQAEEIRPFFRNTVVLPDGVDTQQFYMEKERTGDEIVAGWSENPDRKLHGRRVKRFYEVVEPSCKAAGVELRVGQNMTRDELRRMYNDVDVVLIGSVTEGNPLSLFEAGACGRTVIATRVGVVPEIIEDGYDGFLIDSDLSDLRPIDLQTAVVPGAPRRNPPDGPPSPRKDPCHPHT